jgi:uncharacterized protein
MSRPLLRFGAGVLVHAAIASGSCVPISTWDEFQSSVSRNDDLVFCSFDVVKPTAARLSIAESKTLRCDKPRGCLLRGQGTHLVVGGPNANVSITDFVFQGATSSAVIVSSSSRIRHTFRNCAFLYNTNRDGQVANNEEKGGGAVRANRYTKLRVLNCDFVRNEGVNCGGAIFFLGREILVKNGTFVENKATQGGAIYKGQDAGRMKLSECKFLNNVDVNNENSPAVYVEAMDGVVVHKAVGSNNDNCDGIYIGSTDDCIPFSRMSFELGRLNLEYNGVQFSQGLVADVIAMSGKPVAFTSGQISAKSSNNNFHMNPDGAAITPLVDGGYAYVSNAENAIDEGGGIFSLEFDPHGLVRGYRKLLAGNKFCNGGLTPWNTFVGCEELPGGQCWQVHPRGLKVPMKTVLGGKNGGQFEAFAVDDRDPKNLVFFVTEDKYNGAIRRFRPPPNTPVGWDMLHGSGTHDFLVFHPGNRFSWSTSLRNGRTSADEYYWNVEGALHQNGTLMFVSKVQKELFILDLDKKTYRTESTVTSDLPGGGKMGAQPDQLTLDTNGILFFTEDGGGHPGVFAYDGEKYRTLAQAIDDRYTEDETTGVSLSPDGKWLYFCFQSTGYMFRVRRIDGMPFEGRHVMRWKYVLGD